MSSSGSFLKAGFWTRGLGVASVRLLVLLFLTAVTIVAARSEGLRAAWRGTMIWTSDAISTDTLSSEGSLLRHEFLQVAPGYRFSVGLKTNGTLFAWGHVPQEFPHHLGGVRSVAIAGHSGVALLEDGRVIPLAAGFTPQPGLSNVAEIATSSWGALLRRQDGTLAVWGLDDTKPATPPEVQDAIAVALDGTLAVALRAGGSVVAWDFVGGDVISLPDSFQGVVQIHAGAGGVYGLRSDGSVTGWGGVASEMPDGLKGVTSLATGWSFALALKENGTVVTWGDGPVWAPTTPVPAGLSQVVSIAASAIGAFAVQADGTVVSWGGAAPLTDILSRGVSRIVTRPDSDVLISLGRPVEPVLLQQPSPQRAHAFQGVRFEVNAAGFGLSYQWYQGQTPIRNATNRVYRIGPLQVGGVAGGFGPYWVAIINPLGRRVVTDPVRLEVTGTILPGTVVEWGPEGSPSRIPPEEVHGRVIAAATGATLSTAVLSDGSVRGWTPQGEFLQPAAPGGPRPDSIAVGGGDWFQRSADGRVTAWDLRGRWLSTFQSSDITAVSAAENMLALLDQRGRVWRWDPRWNSGPDGSATLYPVSEIQAVAAGRYGVAMLRPDGTVRVVVLDGSPGAAPPDGLTNVVAIAAGYMHWVALRADGTVVAWHGEDAADVSVPPGLNGVVAIAAGDHHTLALRSDGTLVGWGRVGIREGNPWTMAWQPYRVPPGLSGVSSITAGGVWSSALLGGPPPPRLQLESADEITTAVWHQGTEPAVLESAKRLDESGWSLLPGAPQLEGRWRRTVVPVDEERRFFRLTFP